MLAALDRLVTAERVRAYALILLCGYALGVAGLALSLRHGLDPFGKPLGADFIIFYGAATLALKGHAALAWSTPAILAAERAAVPASRGLFLWAYPPSFLMLIAPLARLPYLAALAVWTGVTGGLYLAMTRMISTDRRGWWLALAFPAVFVTATQGQNGLLTAAILGFGLLSLDRRPWLAGAVLGLIVYKPHFGVLLPLLLLGTGRWRSALATGLSAAAVVGLSAAVFGVESWRAFLDVAPSVTRSLESGALPLAKVPSVFAAARLLGAALPLAYGLQAVVGAAAALGALQSWRRQGPLPLKAGLAVTATLLATPYAFDYDLVLLAIPVGVLAAEALRRPMPPGTRVMLCAISFAPLALPPLASYLHLPLMPVALVALLVAGRRALRADHASNTDPSSRRLSPQPGQASRGSRS